MFDDILKDILQLAQEQNITYSCAESCTGGLLSYSLCKTPGSSRHFLGGIVSYTNQVKMDVLGVNESSIKEYTEVSEQVAKEMAESVLKKTNSTLSLSTTGFAGPTGGTIQHPVGTVYIGVSHKTSEDTIITYAKRLNLNGDRESIINQVVHLALTELQNYLI